jgi:peptidyl-prolyl cis-trans isomerase A (cyclophilin A)
MANPNVVIQTSMGSIQVELFADRAPLSVANFLQYARDGHFAGTVFHRVIPGFMAQTGAHTPDITLKEDDATVPNESGNGLSNVRGTVAMARTRDPP